MTFTRANPLGWAAYEVLTSAQMNQVDLNQSRAIDGYAGGTYNASASLTLNNQLFVDSTAGVGANLVGLTVTGKGSSSGITTTGGATGEGIIATAGAGTASGVLGTGGAGGGIGGEFVAGGAGAQYGLKGTGASGSGSGVQGVAGGAGGHGVVGQGHTGGHGVVGTGGAVSGRGGSFIGGATDGDGLYAVGGATNGNGVVGDGSGTGYGGYFTGGANGAGVYAAGQGANPAAYFPRTATGSTMTIPPAATDPTTPLEGDLWTESTDDELLFKLDGKIHQLLDTWAQVTNTAGGGALTVDVQNNVSGASRTATYVQINFSRSFAAANFSAVATVEHATSGYVPMIIAKATSYVRVAVQLVSTGSFVDPTSVGFILNLVVKGNM